MKYLYEKDLYLHLKNNLNKCYLLFGGNKFLIKKSLNCIKTKAKTYNFNHYIDIDINTDIDWDSIYISCKTKDLFLNNKIITIYLSINNDFNINKEILNLISLLSNKLLIIICIKKLTYEIKKSNWFKKINKRIILINCMTPVKKYFYNWIINYSKELKINLNNDSYNEIYYFYENNITDLDQLFKKLKLIYPKKNLSLSDIKHEIYDATKFKSFNWVNALLKKQTKEAIRIIRKLNLINPLILLRSIQKEILFIAEIKNCVNYEMLYQKFKENNIWKKNRILLIKAIKNISKKQINFAIKLMKKIELNIKNNYNHLINFNFEMLTLLLCEKHSSIIFNYINII